MSGRLEISGLAVRIGRATLLEGVDLSLSPGEFIALVGPNGAGKTTLIRAALGLVRPFEGIVSIDSTDVGALGGRERAAAMAWLAQQALISEPLTALELTQAARFRFDEDFSQSRERAMKALERAGAEEFANRPVTRLSGGEQQRVAVAAMLAQEAPLLLLDEPANHLDAGHQIELYRLVGELWREGHGVLCITHDVNLLHHAAQERAAEVRVAGLREGRKEFELALNDATLPGALGRLLGVRIETVDVDGRRLMLPTTSTAHGGGQ